MVNMFWKNIGGYLMRIEPNDVQSYQDREYKFREIVLMPRPYTYSGWGTFRYRHWYGKNEFWGVGCQSNAGDLINLVVGGWYV
jgi:hypothetical protein